MPRPTRNPRIIPSMEETITTETTEFTTAVQEQQTRRGRGASLAPVHTPAYQPWHVFPGTGQIHLPTLAQVMVFAVAALITVSTFYLVFMNFDWRSVERRAPAYTPIRLSTPNQQQPPRMPQRAQYASHQHEAIETLPAMPLQEIKLQRQHITEVPAEQTEVHARPGQPVVPPGAPIGQPATHLHHHRDTQEEKGGSTATYKDTSAKKPVTASP